MKIRFTEVPKGRDYKIGQVVGFNGAVEEGYARKYIARGWAVQVNEIADQPSFADLQDDANPPRDLVEIPADWRSLKWHEIKSLAARITAEPVSSKHDAVVVIEAELARRSQDAN